MTKIPLLDIDLKEMKQYLHKRLVQECSWQLHPKQSLKRTQVSIHRRMD